MQNTHEIAVSINSDHQKKKKNSRIISLYIFIYELSVVCSILLAN